MHQGRRTGPKHRGKSSERKSRREGEITVKREARRNRISRSLGVCGVSFLGGILALGIVAPGVARAAETYEVIVQQNVAEKMRDGVTLRADIYRPKADGKFPVLLVRTPYDKKSNVEFGLKAAARGYVVIAQDVRGRYTSEGD